MTRRGDPRADRRSTPGSCDNIARARRSSKDELRACRRAGSGRRRPAAARPSSTASPTGSSRTSGTRPRWRSARDRKRRGHRRRRSSSSTPAPPSSRRTRRTTTRPTRTRTKRRRSSRTSKRIMILGGGPNRIGQGIEFDYCCCQAGVRPAASWAIEVVMVNSNPETVSTDYDTSRPALLRAADGRGRAQHLRPRCSPTA